MRMCCEKQVEYSNIVIKKEMVQRTSWANKNWSCR